MSTDTRPHKYVDAEQRRRASHVTLAIAALALGGFAIGTTEFVTMGLLPEIAGGVDASIPKAGHVISAYALGVVVGAPVIVSLSARLPKRALVGGLVLAIALGNALTALAPNYGTLMAARFIAGLPHGAYFGVASLVAASMVSREKRGRAVSGVMLGLSVANLAGVPASTALGQTLGWRSAYWTVVVLAVVTSVAIVAFVPHIGADRDATVGRELRALRSPQVLLTAGVGAVGFGGMFAMYSYIAPTVTQVTGLHRSFVPWVLLAFGIGGVLGTFVGGRLADRALFLSLAGMLVAMAGLLAVFVAASRHPATMVAGVFLVSTAASALALLLQMRLMHVAGDAQMLGAALNHSSLNIANALGAWLGGAVIAAGYGYTAPSAVGVLLAFAGLVVLFVSAIVYRGERLSLSLSH